MKRSVREQEQFLDVLSADEARARWHAALRLDPLPSEDVPLAAALGRVSSRDVLAPGDVPGFDRSNFDGYAVRAEDTFGASERRPVLLELAAERLHAGVAPVLEVAPGTAVPIATGGMLPRGADAVVMVEDSEESAAGLRVVRPVAPGAGISFAGGDVSRGETVLRRGMRLTARETGTLAACGIASVPCVRRPRIAVISTGNEVVPPGAPLEPGRVHDANGTLLAGAIREIGGEAELLGIARDDEDSIAALFDRVREEFDGVVFSGGTSKGEGDLCHRVLARSAHVVVHGVALKPGKPLLLAEYGGKPVVALPGFPSSAIFTYHAFVAPVLRRLLGRGPEDRGSVRARVSRRVASERGRAEFVLVNLLRAREGLLAFPIGKGSGSVTAFAKADGFIEVPASVERLDAGEEVAVTLLGRDLRPADVVVVGSHCTGLDVVVSRLLDLGLTTKVIAVGSRGGLDAAAQGACDAAPIHLFDPKTRRYNEPFVAPGLRLLPGYGRRQGLAFRSERRERFERGTPEEALRSAAADPSLRMANRGPASGTRALVEDLLGPAPGRPPGWNTAYASHTAVAAAIAQGRADWGVCLEQAARAAGLGWRPLREERYDFLVPEDRWDERGARAFREVLGDASVRARLREAGFSA